MSTFSVGANHKFDSAEDVEPFLKGLKDGVTEVNVGGNSWGVEACKLLAEKLREVKTLEVAKLDDMFTGRLASEIPESMEYLVDALLELPHLHTVDLSDNAFGIATIAPLERFLAHHVPLEHLYLANNGFGPEAGHRVGLALKKLAALKKEHNGPPLTTVVCGRNRLENGSMEAWAAFIKSHGTLKTLKLYQNGIRQEGIDQIMREGLAHSPHLQTLDLQDNTFTETGSKALVDVLCNWPSIKELGVSDCLLSAEGSLGLAKELEKSAANLETLRLQYNEIDAEGLGALLSALNKNLKNLKLLELNGNCFSDEHEHVASIAKLFADRGFGELDELDDMEVSSSDDEMSESSESEIESESALHTAARDAEYAESAPAAEEETDSADELARKLKDTKIN